MSGLSAIRGLDWGEILEGPTRTFLKEIGHDSEDLVRDVIGQALAAGARPHRILSVQGAAKDAGVVQPGFDSLTPGTKFFAGIVRNAATSAFGSDVSGPIDTSGDLFAFVGSLADVITNERALTSGSLTFDQVLQLENRLEGMKIILVLGSMLFSVIVDALSLGTLGSITGLVIHLIDDIVGQASAITSVQLWRRAVAEPLQVGFARIHRNQELAPSQAEEAYALGIINDEELVDVFAAAGYNDRAVVTRTALARVRYENQAGRFPVRVKTVSRTVLDQALKAQIISDAEYVQALGDQGYDDFAITVFWGLAQLKNVPPATVG